ncbi:hypothetical protein FOCC_FOCC002136, partial [Frankliniella occidentalis]
MDALNEHGQEGFLGQLQCRLPLPAVRAGLPAAARGGRRHGGGELAVRGARLLGPGPAPLRRLRPLHLRLLHPVGRRHRHAAELVRVPGVVQQSHARHQLGRVPARAVPVRHGRARLHLLPGVLALAPSRLQHPVSEQRGPVSLPQDPGVDVPDDVPVAADGAHRGAAARGLAAAALQEPGLPSGGRACRPPHRGAGLHR